MKIAVEPVLGIQRDLLRQPRGRGRFEDYLAAMIVTGPGQETRDVRVPLALFNPMSKDHVKDLVDALIAHDAESVQREAAAEAGHRLALVAPDFETRLALVVVDDAAGGWTNRGHTELRALLEVGGERKRGFTVVPFWTSEIWTSGDGIWESGPRARLRRDSLASVFRSVEFSHKSPPRTLGDVLRLERLVTEFAGARPASPEAFLTDTDVTLADGVLKRHLAATDLPTIYAALFGDVAAGEVGYASLGLPARAGFAVAARGL